MDTLSNILRVSSWHCKFGRDEVRRTCCYSYQCCFFVAAAAIAVFVAGTTCILRDVQLAKIVRLTHFELLNLALAL